MNKSIKETENLIFLQCKIEFYFTNEHQNLYFRSIFGENTAYGVHSMK